MIYGGLRVSKTITFNQALLGKYYGALVETGEEYHFWIYVIGVNWPVWHLGVVLGRVGIDLCFFILG